MAAKYIHREDIHNLDAPQVIVPLVMELIKPKTVIDVGCGLGTFLWCFKELGVQTVLGLDGNWVNRDQLFKYLEPHEFLEKAARFPEYFRAAPWLLSVLNNNQHTDKPTRKRPDITEKAVIRQFDLIAAVEFVIEN